MLIFTFQDSNFNSFPTMQTSPSHLGQVCPPPPFPQHTHPMQCIDAGMQCFWDNIPGHIGPWTHRVVDTSGRGHIGSWTLFAKASSFKTCFVHYVPENKTQSSDYGFCLAELRCYIGFKATIHYQVLSYNRQTLTSPSDSVSCLIEI